MTIYYLIEEIELSDFKRELAELFDKFYDKRICVLGTTCCGKRTLQSQFVEAVDIDEVVWQTRTNEEESDIC